MVVRSWRLVVVDRRKLRLLLGSRMEKTVMSRWVLAAGGARQRTMDDSDKEVAMAVTAISSRVPGLLEASTMQWRRWFSFVVHAKQQPRRWKSMEMATQMTMMAGEEQRRPGLIDTTMQQRRKVARDTVDDSSARTRLWIKLAAAGQRQAEEDRRRKESSRWCDSTVAMGEAHAIVMVAADQRGRATTAMMAGMLVKRR